MKNNENAGRFTSRWTLAGLCGCVTVVAAACGGGGSGGNLRAATDAGVPAPEQSGTTAPPAVVVPEPATPPATPPAGTPAPTVGDTPVPQSAPALAAAPAVGGCELFPPEAIFNTRIDDPARFPVHARSAAWIGSVGAGTRFRADWGRSEDPTQRSAYYGMPINVVGAGASATQWPVIAYDYRPTGVWWETGWPHESDCAVESGTGFDRVRGCTSVAPASRRFPIPLTPKLEAGTCNDPATCGDRHLLVVEAGACRLWESYKTYNLGGHWYALATASWDLNSLAMRPRTWTAADAAGLPITPFLVKAAEVAQGEIRHALRVTFRDAVLSREFTWPARHGAGGDTPGGIPFGALLRLRADFVIPSTWNAQARAIATAAKQYGLYVADIGEDFYVQGEPSVAWEPATFSQLGSISLSQMEFVDLGSVRRDPRFSEDSMAGRWR